MIPLIGCILARLPVEAYTPSENEGDEPSIFPGIVTAEVVMSGSLKKRSGDFSEVIELEEGDLVAVNAASGQACLGSEYTRCRWYNPEDIKGFEKLI